MKVRSGWSIDYAKKKFDVELEDHDIASLLEARGIDPEVHDITLREKFQIAWYETEIIAATTFAVEKGVKPQEDVLVQTLQGRQKTAVTAVKARLGIEEPSSA